MERGPWLRSHHRVIARSEFAAWLSVDRQRPRRTGSTFNRHGWPFERALKDFFETFPLFVALVLVAQLSGIHNQLTELGSFLYLGARVAYLPLYAFGVFLVRSLVWNVAAVGMLLFVIAILRV